MSSWQVLDYLSSWQKPLAKAGVKLHTKMYDGWRHGWLMWHPSPQRRLLQSVHRAAVARQHGIKASPARSSGSESAATSPIDFSPRAWFRCAGQPCDPKPPFYRLSYCHADGRQGCAPRPRRRPRPCAHDHAHQRDGHVPLSPLPSLDRSSPPAVFSHAAGPRVRRRTSPLSKGSDGYDGDETETDTCSVSSAFTASSSVTVTGLRL